MKRKNKLVNLLIEEINEKINENKKSNFGKIARKIEDMVGKKIIRPNHHTFMELILARYLLEENWNVDVEHKLGNNLIADLYAEKDYIKIIEVENGFVSSKSELTPITYRKMREIAKISRYSHYSDEFGFATMPDHVLYIDPLFYEDFEKQDAFERARKIKNMLDIFYKSPKIPVEDIVNAHIEKVYLVDVDNINVVEMNVRDYLKKRGKIIDLFVKI